MDDLSSPPVLSTPAEELLSRPTIASSHHVQLSEAQLEIQYEIKRTIDEIRARKWQRVGLQFPDAMLVDAPHVLIRLRDGLGAAQMRPRLEYGRHADQESTQNRHDAAAQDSRPGRSEELPADSVPVKLTILGDTSYGACCVDEIAAEHIAADGVVHYGRTCLSPTQRLPVLYIFTSQALDLNEAVADLIRTAPEYTARILLLADVPWQHHLDQLAAKLDEIGYVNVVVPDLIHNPSSPIPNRALPQDLQAEPSALDQVDIFHVGDPPTALLLTLAAKVRSIHVHIPGSPGSSQSSISALSRRRYASLLKLSSAAVIGILVNTLSVKNYMTALEHVQQLIASKRKKAYTFVVGKLNPAKLANFAEVDGWVVIGCWESSLIDSKEFHVPVITPYELEVALQRDDERTWGGEWIADFDTVLRRNDDLAATDGDDAALGKSADKQDQSSDDEPPEFDLRTGKYISHPRPRAMDTSTKKQVGDTNTGSKQHSSTAMEVAQRHKSDLALVNGIMSPGAQYLRSQREWTGLGSDFAIEYDRDEDGKIQGATIEQGRAGVAKGYSHAEGKTQS